MRSLLLCLFILLLTVPVQAQQVKATSKASVSELYQLKSKKQKSGAKCLLIGGGVVGLTSVVMLATASMRSLGGLVTLNINQAAEESQKAKTWGWIGAASGVAVLGSIPLFVASSRNARKAQSMLSLQLEARPRSRIASSMPRAYPAVGVHLDF